MHIRSKLTTAASVVVTGLMAQSVFAASQTWSATPTDANWTTAANWAGAAVPGINPTANNHNTTDIATFNSAIFGTIGSSSNPIIPDGVAGNVSSNRMIGQIIFDTASVGSYYFGASGTTNVLQFRNNTNGTSGIVDIQVNAAVTNAQIFNSPIALHLPSSTNGFGTVANDSTTASATLTLAGGINNSPNSTRGSVWTLSGANTGLNTISGVINLTNSGGQTSRIVKNGTGTWSLTNANTIGGGTTVDAGTLIAGNIQALGVAANAVTVNAGTLEVGNVALANNSLTLNNGGTIRGTGTSSVNAIVVGAAAADVSLGAVGSSDVFTAGVSSVISGGSASSIIHAVGAGTLALNTVNTYTGNWSFDGGKTQLAAAVSNTLGSNPGANFAGGTLALNDNATTFKYLSGTSGTLTNNGAAANTVTVNQSTDTSFAGAITDGTGGSIAVTKSGTGMLTTSGTSTYTGATAINGGGMRVNGSLTNSAVTVGATATLGGNGTIGNSVTVSGSGKITPGSAQSNIGTLTVGSLTMSAGSTGEFEFGTGNDLINVTASNGLTLSGGALALYVDGTTNPFAAVGTYTLFDYAGTLGGAVSNLSVSNPQAGFNYSFVNDTTNTLVKLQITSAGVTYAWNVDADGDFATNSNWNPSTGHPSNPGDTATFGSAITTNHTVSLNGNQTTGSLIFNNATASYTVAQGTSGTLALSSGTNGGVGITVQAGSHTVSAPVNIVDTAGVNVNVFNSSTLTVTGAVSGNGLTKNGPGTLVLSNGANSITSATLNAGVTEFASGALGGNTSPLTFNGGTLKYSTGNTQDISAKTVSMPGNATIDTNGNNVTLANAIGGSGAGGLTKSGTGTLTLNGANTHTGATTVNGGTLAINSNSSLGNPASGSAVTLNGGTLHATATLALDNAGSNNRAITIGAGGGSLSAAASTVMTVSGSLNGSGALSKSGAGDVDISADNSATFTGPVTINSGILRLQNGNGIAGSVWNNTGAGTLAYGAAVTAASVKSINGDQNIALTNDGAAGVALSFGSDNTAWTYNGSFSGLGSIVKQGSGLLTLTGTSTITGSVTLQNVGSALTIPTGGSLTASSYQATGIAGGLLTISGGTLIANTATSNILNGGGGGPGNTGISVTGGTATFADVNLATDNNNANIPFVVTGGTVTMANFTTGRSGTAVTAEPVAGGTNYGLYVNGAGAVVNITGNANIGQSALANSNSNMRIDAGALNITGTTILGDNNAGRWTALDVNGGTFTDAGTITFGHPSGASRGTFIVRGTGVATVDKIDFGTLTTASFGTVQVLTGGTLYVGSGGIAQTNANGSGIVRLTGGTLGTSANLTPVVPINLNGAAGAQGTFKAADASNVAHDITINTPMYGTGGFIKTGAGSMTVTGMSSYTGPVTNNAGTLTLSSPVVAGVPLTITDTLAGLNTIVVSNTAGVQVGQMITGTGTGLPEGTIVTSVVDGTTLTVNNNATATVTGGSIAANAEGSGPLGVGTKAVINNGTLNLPAVALTVTSLDGTGTTNLLENLNSNTHVSQGTLNIPAGKTVTVATGGTTAGVSVIGSLNTTSTSKMELHDNDLIVDYGAGPSSYTSVVNKVKDGLVLLGGSGNGGISSAEVDAQTIQGTILAVVDDGDANIGGAITATSGFTIPNPTSSVVVKFTWFGDSNLDGIVDGSDYALLDSGFTSGGSLGGWVFGDYDYSGTVDGSDYALIDTGFISQNAVLPEPTTLGLLGLGAMGMLRRRRQA